MSDRRPNLGNKSHTAILIAPMSACPMSDRRSNLGNKSHTAILISPIAKTITPAFLITVNGYAAGKKATCDAPMTIGENLPASAITLFPTLVKADLEKRTRVSD